MKIEVKLDETCEETSVTIVAKKMTDEVNELVSRLSNHCQDLIVGFCDGIVIMIDKNIIIRIYTANQKVFIVTASNEYSARLRLYQLEERLNGSEFVRISHSEIINLKMVRDFDLSFAGSICVRFHNGSTTYVSRRYVSKIKTIL
ncbi:MAG: LytTR family transcriptional regulator [Coriobacteriales bacterium]|jgi:DNA-binding LytR/AlgR family response regulator|nr:LytTR family transcriptional regulator [Coriobacteriales bacterium]